MTVLDTVIGWLAPPVCLVCGVEGESMCGACVSANIVPFGECCFNCAALSAKSKTCARCSAYGFPWHVWVSTDYGTAAKDLVGIYKFGHQRVAAKSIAPLMVESFMCFNSHDEILENNYLIVPVPTASSRARQRGFDHSALLARLLARQLSMRYAPAMMRLGQNRQVGKTRAERIRQAEGRYIVKNPKDISGRNILLIDDVVTTGATLAAATKALRQAGAKKIDALVFAKRL